MQAVAQATAPNTFIKETKAKLAEVVKANFEQKAVGTTVNWLTQQILSDGKGYENIQTLKNHQSEILDVISKNQDAEKADKYKSDIETILKLSEGMALTQLDKSNQDLSCHSYRMGFNNEDSLKVLESSLENISAEINIKTSKLSEPEQKQIIINLIEKAASGTITKGDDFSFEAKLERLIGQHNFNAQKDNKFITAKALKELKKQVPDSKNELETIHAFDAKRNGILANSILQASAEGFNLGSGSNILATKLEKLEAIPEAQLIDLAKEASKNPASKKKIIKVLEKFDESLAKELKAINEENAKNGHKTEYRDISQVVNDEQKLKAVNNAIGSVQEDIKALDKNEQALLKTSALKKKSADYTKKHGNSFGKLFFAGMISKVGFAAIVGMALSLIGGGFMMPAVIAFLGACAAGLDSKEDTRQPPPPRERNIISLDEASSKQDNQKSSKVPA